MDTISVNLEVIRRNIPASVLLVAVSKRHSEEKIMQAYHYGQRHFAESRPQELLVKAQRLPSDIVWHFIGHLQKNKVKMVVPTAHIIHSMDSIGLMDAVEDFCSVNNCAVNCLLQVHIAREEQKFGFSPQKILEFFENNCEHNFPHLNIQGLMGIASNTNATDIIRSEFVLLKSIYDRIKILKPNLNFVHLSMGMSGDYTIGIEVGATLVRIGSTIFGGRV
jgi:pyridoxal phosphate enzyme (YggS family)